MTWGDVDWTGVVVTLSGVDLLLVGVVAAMLRAGEEEARRREAWFWEWASHERKTL